MIKFCGAHHTFRLAGFQVEEPLQPNHSLKTCSEVANDQSEICLQKIQ